MFHKVKYPVRGTKSIFIWPNLQSLQKQMWNKHMIFWSNHVILACFYNHLSTFIMICVSQDS